MNKVFSFLMLLVLIAGITGCTEKRELQKNYFIEPSESVPADTDVDINIREEHPVDLERNNDNANPVTD